MIRWSDDLVAALKAELAQQSNVREAVRIVAGHFGEPLTVDAVANKFRRLDLGKPSDWLRRQVDPSEWPTIESCPGHEDDEPPTIRRGAAPDPDVRRLLDLVQKRSASLEDACNALNLSPAACRALVLRAKTVGYAVELAHGELSWKLPEARDDVQDAGIAAVIGERCEVAVISDLHFGSKWCGRAQLRDFLSYARDRGITHVLNPGDTLDGVYKHSRWEQSHQGFDAQAEDALDLFRDYPELTFHAIDGNHDDTLSESCGMQAGLALVERARSHGVENLRYYGTRSALLRVYGAIVHLWHPRGSGAYALSYKLQKKVESYAPGQKPDILLTGHYHQSCAIEERGVHAFLCPTFQLPGGSFSNSLTGSPAIGGRILGWQLTEDGTLRRFTHERVAYYAGEKPRGIVFPDDPE